MTLIDRIEHEMQTDDEDRHKQSQYLRRAFHDATASERTVVDACFIALCGYSLTTLIAAED
jgi:hypothetical protein